KSALATAFAVALMGAVAAGLNEGAHRASFHVPPPLRSLTLALVLSFVPMFAKAVAAGPRAFGRAVLFALGASVAYFAGHEAFESLIPSMEPGPELTLRWWIVVAGLGALFLAQTILQASPNGILARLLQPYIHSGLYLDDWFTRVTFRLWPPLLERAAAARPSTTIRPSRESRIF